MAKKSSQKSASDILSRIKALQAIIHDSEKPRDQARKEEYSEAVAKAVEIEGRRKYFSLRDRWSNTIIIWISALILFNCAVTIAVGLGGLSYPNLEWFITAVLVQTFLQIVGLGLIAVKYLFSN